MRLDSCTRVSCLLSAVASPSAAIDSEGNNRHTGARLTSSFCNLEMMNNGSIYMEWALRTW